jgi:catechol 2,3-dioxygenase-like lactoylglutathione lyase family enzyme
MLMLAQARLLANFKSADLDRTIGFYEGTLGLPVLHRREILPGVEEVRFGTGGGILCFESGDPQGKTNDLAGWDVDDVDATVAALRERGVVFEEYDYPSLKTVNGVATVGSMQAAWFKDPDGNLLALVSS